jgi:hypothetical protein
MAPSRNADSVAGSRNRRGGIPMKVREIMGYLPENEPILLYEPDGLTYFETRAHWPFHSDLGERDVDKIAAGVTGGITGTDKCAVIVMMRAPEAPVEGGSKAPDHIWQPIDFKPGATIAITKEIKIRLTFEVEGMDDEVTAPI